MFVNSFEKSLNYSKNTKVPRLFLSLPPPLPLPPDPSYPFLSLPRSGCEDSLLQSLLKMAASEGLTLPLKASSAPETGKFFVPPDDSSYTSDR
jgi:hypothetical protein